MRLGYGRWEVTYLDHAYVLIYKLYLEIGELYGYIEEFEEEFPKIARFSPKCRG